MLTTSTALAATSCNTASTAEESTFLFRLIDAEERRHAERLSTIKRLSSNLVAFEPTVRALEEQGIRLSDNSFLGDGWKGAFSISVGLLPEDNVNLYGALIHLGYQEQSRLSSPVGDVVYLKRGRLWVSFSVPHNYGIQEPATGSAA